ncbi:unnamed protein product, partial [Oppiella nova]
MLLSYGCLFSGLVLVLVRILLFLQLLRAHRNFGYGLADSGLDQTFNSEENIDTNNVNEKCPQLSFSDNDIEVALNRAQQMRDKLKHIESDIQTKGLFIDTTKISAAARHLIPSQNKLYLRELHENQRFFEDVSRHLIQNRSLSREEALSLKDSNVESHKLIRRKRQTCRSQQPVPCVKSRFRTADGSCNNARNTRWGKSFECVARLLDPEYADGVSVPRVARSGRPLPNPRILSVTIHPQEDFSANFTHMLMQFGQFLDHDISLSPVTQLRSGGIQCCPRPTHPDCFEIPILPNDGFFNRMGKRCINFVRSIPCESCRTGARLQMNELSAFIDASNVYGNSLNESFALRDKDGLLAVGLDRKGRHILPESNNIANDQCSRPNKVCFRAGDNSRVNQHPALTTLHTLWMRQHNRVASALKQLNPSWDAERVFQETRRIIGAQMQMIAYNEFLPVVLGPKVMQFYKLNILGTGFTKYDPAVNPSILSEFSTAAFRFGHSIVNGRFSLISSSTPSQKSSYNLRDNFFTPTRMHNGQMDFILRGLVGRNAQRFDPFCHGDLRNHLYQPRGQVSGSDLPAMNIQRGRDHGIPGYVHYLRFCFNEQITSFEQLDQYMPSSQRQRFQQNYQHVEDIDLFSGGISELPMNGAIVGPTFACIIGTQFNHLKSGDRFYFEHEGQDGSFTSGQLQALRKTLFSRIICINGDNFKEIHSKVFQLNSDRTCLTICLIVLFSTFVTIKAEESLLKNEEIEDKNEEKIETDFKDTDFKDTDFKDKDIIDKDIVKNNDVYPDPNEEYTGNNEYSGYSGGYDPDTGYGQVNGYPDNGYGNDNYNNYNNTNGSTNYTTDNYYAGSRYHKPNAPAAYTFPGAVHYVPVPVVPPVYYQNYRNPAYYQYLRLMYGRYNYNYRQPSHQPYNQFNYK